MPKLMGSWWAGFGGGLGALGACSIPVAVSQKGGKNLARRSEGKSQQGQTVLKCFAGSVSIVVQPSAQCPACPCCLKQASFRGLGLLYRLC